MSNIDIFPIDWTLPIIPSKSIAGIKLGETLDAVKVAISQYVVDKHKSLYRFENSPVLLLKKQNWENPENQSGYTFFVYDVEITNWRIHFNSSEHVGVEKRALSIMFKNDIVCAVKVWNFECVGDSDKPKYAYKGKLPEGVGLNDSISELLNYTKLDFDSTEEWFYPNESYGGLEITGYGLSLEDMPEQKIMALAVI